MTLQDARWQMCSTPPDAASRPEELARAGAAWLDVAGPSTAAAALRAAGAWSLDGPPRRFDAEDWWWRASFAGRAAGGDEETALCFDGLATLAEVWLDGAPLFASDDMFLAERRVVALSGEHELHIRCRSLDAALAGRRPRPRWRAPMIEQQQLRYVRTTLLGRTPGWSPPAAAVGPWRPIRLELARRLAVDEVKLDARVAGATGRLEAAIALRPLGGALGPVELVVERGDVQHRVRLDGGRGTVEVPGVERWWPHTHGEPALYAVRLEADGHRVELGRVGFRDVAVDTRDRGFAVSVNGVPVFCRGACWTPLDPVALAADRATTRAALVQARDAGMNMLRVGGTMVYESDDFLDLADELGILLWQDFMFANLDYPDDEPFVRAVTAEARQQLARLRGRPSLAVLCGNSEVEQQAAMWGAPASLWRPPLFHDVLARLAAEARPDVPYWPSSAHGGAFPHAADEGTTSYYGVGAYLRPLEDARRAEVRFATECLAFANVPSPAAMADLPATVVHHPGWKARVPRDLGASWDFDDVRDHYVARLFGVDPVATRIADPEQYLALGRAATGEVMAQVFGEWRRARSTCRGGLIWFLRDLWPGAGWGVIDSAGRPKAAWFYLRRALQPVGLHISDEGGNGLALHAINERAVPLAAELELVLYRGETVVAQETRLLELAERATLEMPVSALLEGFVDASFAYRFGPPPCDLVVATLRAPDGAALARARHLPLGAPSRQEADLGLSAAARAREDGDLDLELRSRRYAHDISVEVPGFLPEDDHFFLAPGETRALRLSRAAGPARAPRGVVRALNASAAVRVQVQS